MPRCTPRVSAAAARWSRVRADEAQAARTESVLDGWTPVNLATRRAEYETEGWANFDPSAAPLTATVSGRLSRLPASEGRPLLLPLEWNRVSLVVWVSLGLVAGSIATQLYASSGYEHSGRHGTVNLYGCGPAILNGR